MSNPQTDWDALLTVTARRGDAAAAAQTLGYANNPSDEALAFRQALLDALERPQAPSPSTHQDSPKVPWPSVSLYRRPGEMPNLHESLEGGDEAETYIPVSPLLSDEVKAAALNAFGRSRHKPTELAIADVLQAVIEHVGGGQGAS